MISLKRNIAIFIVLLYCAFSESISYFSISKRNRLDKSYLMYFHGFYTFHKSLLPFNICLYIYCLTTFIVHNITLFSLPSSSSSSILYPKNSSNFLIQHMLLVMLLIHNSYHELGEQQ